MLIRILLQDSSNVVQPDPFMSSSTYTIYPDVLRWVYFVKWFFDRYWLSIVFRRLNPLMHNVVKWPNIQSMFGHFTTLCIKELNWIFQLKQDIKDMLVVHYTSCFVCEGTMLILVYFFLKKNNLKNC